jgi:hypothetical protein
MTHHRAAPRQIYASTVTRRGRRRLRTRGRGRRGIVLVTVATLLAAIAVLATITPGLS